MFTSQQTGGGGNKFVSVGLGLQVVPPLSRCQVRLGWCQLEKTGVKNYKATFPSNKELFLTGW